MPLITGRLNNRRAIIDVGLQPTTVAVDPVSGNSSALKIDIRPLRGLIDTGAQMTCITRRVAATAGLKARGKRLVGNVSNVEFHTSYSFVLGVWYSNQTEYETAAGSGYYAFEAVFGCDFKDNDDFDVLIGMDIIQQGDFSTKRDGSFVWKLY